jgi:hypothetical protein
MKPNTADKRHKYYTDNFAETRSEVRSECGSTMRRNESSGSIRSDDKPKRKFLSRGGGTGGGVGGNKHPEPTSEKRETPSPLNNKQRRKRDERSSKKD